MDENVNNEVVNGGATGAQAPKAEMANEAPGIDAPKNEVRKSAAPKKPSGMVIGLGFAVMAAVLGVAFGVIALVGGKQAAEDYENKIAMLTQANSNLEAQIEEMQADISETGYYYMPEFGVKVARPANWQTAIGHYNYTSSEEPGGPSSFMIVMKGGLTEEQFNAVVIVSQCEVTEYCVKVDDSEIGVQIEGEVPAELTNFFTTTENYSKM